MLPTDFLQHLGTALALVGVPLAIVEYVWIWRRRRLDRTRLKETLANVSPVVPALLTTGIAFALWLPVFDALHGALGWTLPTSWATALLAVVAADFVYYWEHRIEHRVRGLWALYHSVHHSSPVFEQSTAYRISFVDSFVTPVFFLPMVLLGFSAEVTLVALGVVIAYQTWIHTELVRRMPRWFEAVFNTASHHRVHHGSTPGTLDRNYGGLLIVWDKWFGTFAAEIATPATSEGLRPRYGLTKPIASANPVDVHLCELRRLAADIGRAPSWRERWALVRRPPGWAPAGMLVSGG